MTAEVANEMRKVGFQFTEEDIFSLTAALNPANQQTSLNYSNIFSFLSTLIKCDVFPTCLVNECTDIKLLEARKAFSSALISAVLLYSREQDPDSKAAEEFIINAGILIRRLDPNLYGLFLNDIFVDPDTLPVCLSAQLRPVIHSNNIDKLKFLCTNLTINEKYVHNSFYGKILVFVFQLNNLNDHESLKTRKDIFQFVFNLNGNQSCHSYLLTQTIVEAMPRLLNGNAVLASEKRTFCYDGLVLITQKFGPIQATLMEYVIEHFDNELLKWFLNQPQFKDDFDSTSQTVMKERALNGISLSTELSLESLTKLASISFWVGNTKALVLVLEKINTRLTLIENFPRDLLFFQDKKGKLFQSIFLNAIPNGSDLEILGRIKCLQLIAQHPEGSLLFVSEQPRIFAPLINVVHLINMEHHNQWPPLVVLFKILDSNTAELLSSKLCIKLHECETQEQTNPFFDIINPLVQRLNKVRHSEDFPKVKRNLGILKTKLVDYYIKHIKALFENLNPLNFEQNKIKLKAFREISRQCTEILDPSDFPLDSFSSLIRVQINHQYWTESETLVNFVYEGLIFALNHNTRLYKNSLSNLEKIHSADQLRAKFIEYQDKLSLNALNELFPVVTFHIETNLTQDVLLKIKSSIDGLLEIPRFEFLDYDLFQNFLNETFFHKFFNLSYFGSQEKYACSLEQVLQNEHIRMQAEQFIEDNRDSAIGYLKHSMKNAPRNLEEAIKKKHQTIYEISSIDFITEITEDDFYKQCLNHYLEDMAKKPANKGWLDLLEGYSVSSTNIEESRKGLKLAAKLRPLFFKTTDYEISSIDLITEITDHASYKKCLDDYLEDMAKDDANKGWLDLLEGYSVSSANIEESRRGLKLAAKLRPLFFKTTDWDWQAKVVKKSIFSRKEDLSFADYMKDMGTTDGLKFETITEAGDQASIRQALGRHRNTFWCCGPQRPTNTRGINIFNVLTPAPR